MLKRQHIWWKAAGLLLTASPVLAQGAPEDMPPRADVIPLPQPRRTVIVPATPQPGTIVAPPNASCGPNCADKGDFWSAWARWHNQKHADCQAHMWGYPQEWKAPPLGATMHTHFRVMVANGEAAGMVLYRYDFADRASDSLNLHGRDRLTKIACMMAQNSYPIIIERTPEAPEVAEKRRTAILNILSMNNIPVTPDRVIIGPSIAFGMSGIEADRIQALMLENLRVQGAAVPIPAGGGGIGTGAVGPGSIGAGTGTGGGR
jgi:hypothetical protein